MTEPQPRRSVALPCWGIDLLGGCDPWPPQSPRATTRSGARASTAGDTSRVERRLIEGHSPIEPVVGYSRAVVSGSKCPCRRHRPDPEGRGAAGERVRPDAAVPRDRERRARAGRRRFRRRGPHVHVHRRRRRLARDRTRSQRGVRRHPPRVDSGRRQGIARPDAGAWRSKRRPSCHREADLSQLDHRQGRSPGRERARAHVREVGPVHARRRGGVHAPGRRDVRPRPAHRHRAAGDLRPRAPRAANERGADAVGARDRDPGLPERRRRPARAAEATRVRERGRARVGNARLARRGRIRSASSSASGSRRATATGTWSTSSSTSPAAS